MANQQHTGFPNIITGDVLTHLMCYHGMVFR